MHYLGKEVGAYGIPDSEGPARPSEGNMFLGFSLNVFERVVTQSRPEKKSSVFFRVFFYPYGQDQRGGVGVE